MEKIAIVTDSCADLPKELVEKYKLFVLPIIVQSEEKEYRDGVDITVDDVYRMQKEEMLKTASPTGRDVFTCFDEVKDKGYTKAIAVLLSSGLSTTPNEVSLLVQDIDDLDIAVYDSKTGSIGCGVIAVTLAQYRDQGLSFEQLKEKCEQLIKDTNVFFSIDTYEYLQKGGRVGKVTSFIGGSLKIKPILGFDEDGAIDVPVVARGSKKVPAKLIDLVSRIIEDNPGRRFKLVVAQGAMKEERDKLKATLLSKFPDYIECIEAVIGAALSCHLGPGVLGCGVQFID